MNVKAIPSIFMDGGHRLLIEDFRVTEGDPHNQESLDTLEKILGK